MASASRRSSISSEPVRYIDDFVLIEILLRLHSAKSAIQCKLVCPHWNSVISAPHFSTRFVDYHSTSRNKLQKPFAITYPSGCPYTLFSNDSIFQGLNYDSAIYFPKSSPSNHRTLYPRATYNELMLCLGYHDCYYICNPLTKHHVALPPFPVRSSHTTPDVVGFLCHGQSSFRVVRILRPCGYVRESVTMHIFSSEENKWTEYSLDRDGNAILSDGLAMALPWNGLLCWKPDKNNCLNKTLVFCNPYSPDNERFHVIATPPETQKSFGKRHTIRHGLGVCQGALRVWHQWEGPDVSQNFSVWDLKDYNTEEWSLKHEVRMEPDVYCDSWRHQIQLAAFDPNDEDVAYFVNKRSLFSLNMRSRDLSKVKTSHPKGNFNMNFFMLVMPGFPTPVPILPQNATASDAIAMPSGRITRSILPQNATASDAIAMPSGRITRSFFKLLCVLKLSSQDAKKLKK